MNHQNRLVLAVLVVGFGCQQQTGVSPQPLINGSEQLLVVTTPDWSSTTGSMRRFERASSTAAWQSIDQPEPVVVGRTGIAWGVGFDSVSSDGPHKK